MMISQILKATYDDNTVKYRGKQIGTIEIVGIVIKEKVVSNHLYFTVDDGSGLLDCHVFDLDRIYQSHCYLQYESLLWKLVKVQGTLYRPPFSILFQASVGSGELSAL